MWNATRLVAVVGGIGALLWATGSRPQAEPRFAEPVRDYAVSGPYTHDNLSIFLLHGPDTLPPRPVKTLDEALAAGTAVVHETGTVNTLCVENLSGDDDLMMQNGDILKGGKQDRVLQVAMILPPKSGRVAVPAFWPGLAVGHFAANPGQIAGKALKNAVNTVGVQGEVWKTVAAQQAALSDRVGKPVNGTASPSSLQLAMEDKDLQAKLAGYRAALANTLDGKKWVVGYAIAVNGKVTGAEVFGSGVLLAKAWPKAVSAAAVEALSEKQEGKFAAVTDDAVTAFLTDAGKDDAPPAAENRADEVYGPRSVAFQVGHGGIAVANPTLAGRSASSRDRLVTSHGGQDQQVEQFNWPALNVAEQPGPVITLESPAALNRDGDTQVIPLESLGAVVVRGRSQPQLPRPLPTGGVAGVAITSTPAGNMLQHLAGNPFNAWQVGHRAEIPAGGRPPAPAVSALPVRVNRTAGKNGVMVESRDRANPGVVIHRTFIAK